MPVSTLAPTCVYMRMSAYTGPPLNERMSVHMSIHMSIHMSAHMSIHMSAHMSIHVSIHVSACMSMHMSVHNNGPQLIKRMHIHMPIHMSTHMSVHDGPAAHQEGRLAARDVHVRHGQSDEARTDLVRHRLAR